MIYSIRLQNFRLFKDRQFEFNEQVNIIVGPNACGKTSLIEGILVNLTGSSYRVKDPMLVKENESWFRLDIETDRNIRVLKYENNLKTFDIDENKYKRLPSSMKDPVVLFEPNILNMLTSSPDGRRSYLDNLLKQIDIHYAKDISQYNRVLLQRNRLLKDLGPNDYEQIFPWNIRLVQLAEKITKRRVAIVQEINPLLNSNYKKISNSNMDVLIVYSSNINLDNYSNNLLKNLEDKFQLELSMGFTSSGPHRDDFGLLFNDKPAISVASRGELRSAMLSLKVVEVILLEKYLNLRPILLLDDVFSELDENRRHSLTYLVKEYQSFITTTDADIAAKEFKGHCKVIKLSESN